MKVIAFAKIHTTIPVHASHFRYPVQQKKKTLQWLQTGHLITKKIKTWPQYLINRIIFYSSIHLILFFFFSCLVLIIDIIMKWLLMIRYCRDYSNLKNNRYLSWYFNQYFILSTINFLRTFHKEIII